MSRLSALLTLGLSSVARGFISPSGFGHALGGARQSSSKPAVLQRRAATPLALGGAESFWGDYLNLLDTAPLVTKSITAGVIIGAGDSAAQLVENSKAAGEGGEVQSFDFARASRWAFFGLVLQGPWNHAFYLLLDGAIPPTPDPWTLQTLEKVAIDQGIQAPIFTAIILCFFAVIEGKGLDFAKTQVKEELGGILLKNWAVFIPATVINQAFCPPQLRVLFLNCVFFGWVIYLSLVINSAEEESA